MTKLDITIRLRDNAKNAIISGNYDYGYFLLDAAQEIEDLRAEVARLDKLAYLRIPIPKFLQRKGK